MDAVNLYFGEVFTRNDAANQLAYGKEPLYRFGQWSWGGKNIDKW
jgi:hypothetical protein